MDAVELLSDTHAPLACFNSRRLATSVERLSPEFDTLIAPDANLEELMSGLGWAEGPVWISEGDKG